MIASDWSPETAVQVKSAVSNVPFTTVGEPSAPDSATFAGRLHYFEIWQPERFRAHQVALRQRLLAQGGGMPPVPGA